MKKRHKLEFFTALLGFSASFTGSMILYNKFLRRSSGSPLKPEVQALTEQIKAERSEDIIGITSFDGLQLKAHLFPGDPDSHVYALLIHGYRDQAYTLMPYAVHFMKKGYHVLMPDLRGHGLSEGSYVGFGYHDHFDILQYIELICERDPQAQIFLLGVSMGAATAMLTSGEFLPSQVKCIIEDCGYTSAWEQCRYNMRTIYHLPAFPILHMTSCFMKLRHGYSLQDAAPIRAVSKAIVPMLFIHGDRDDFVPFHMHQPLYEACSSEEKELLVMAGAVHAVSVHTDPALYWKTVDAFLSRHLKR